MFLTLVNSFKQFDVNVSLTSGGPSSDALLLSVVSAAKAMPEIYVDIQ